MLDPTIQGRLERFSIKLRYQLLMEKREQVEIDMMKLVNKPKRLLTKILLCSCCIISAEIIVIFQLFNTEQTLEKSSLLFIFALIIPLLLTFMEYSSSYQENRRERQQYERKLREIDKELKKRLICMNRYK